MEKRINRTLSKISNDTQKANSQNISNLSSPSTQMFGRPGCPHCGGVGYLRADVPLGHEKFGRLEPCVCRANEIAQNARQRLYELSNLEHLSHLTFENFSRSGNPKAEFMSPQEAASLHDACDASETFARDLQGWLLLEGSYGAGKTHLAAAIANAAVYRGMPTLFITVPDLLDSLRFSFSDATTSFETRFEDIRNAALLVMDDFGTHNATPWAQEKIFQIINYRYINKLPTVITTNLILDEIESRIRSRLQDSDYVKHIRITASDYRRPKETSNPGISMLPSPELKGKTFSNFQSRENEIGKTDKIVTTSERRDSFGNKIKEKEITHISVTQADIDTLKEAAESAYTFALDPKGWFVLLGPPYCGKTHLAAAIGNYRLKQ
ncbi:MAG TPA: ATP-binding protein, partial [Anaerolineales bacterium]|nr:ATP-binding protein [Anaerolineales bacterium]